MPTRRIQDKYICSRCGKSTYVPAGQSPPSFCCRWSYLILANEDFAQSVHLVAQDEYDIARLKDSISRFGVRLGQVERRLRALEREARAAARAIVAFSERLRESGDILDRLADLDFEENGGPGEDDGTIAFVDKEIIKALVDAAQARRDRKKNGR